MHDTYAKMQSDGLTGPLMKVDGQMVPRPGYMAEYPKWVTKADGKRAVVKNLAEEIAVAGEQSVAPDDPLAEQRNALTSEAKKFEDSRKALDEMREQMKAQLAELEEARAALQSSPKGSAFRPASKSAPASVSS